MSPACFPANGCSCFAWKKKEQQILISSWSWWMEKIRCSVLLKSMNDWMKEDLWNYWLNPRRSQHHKLIFKLEVKTHLQTIPSKKKKVRVKRVDSWLTLLKINEFLGVAAHQESFQGQIIVGASKGCCGRVVFAVQTFGVKLLSYYWTSKDPLKEILHLIECHVGSLSQQTRLSSINNNNQRQ